MTDITPQPSTANNGAQQGPWNGTPQNGRKVFGSWILTLTGASFLIVVFVWLYGPALGLPVSLFDEGVYLNNSDQVWANWLDRGPLWALREDVFTKARALKPGAPMLYALVYWLVGESRLWMHALLLGLLALTAVTLAVVPWLEMKRLRWSGREAGVAVFAGVTAAFLLLGGEVPGWSGVQSLRVNWYRLHTSEALIAPCLMLHLVLLLRGLTTLSNRRRWILLALSMVPLLAAGTTKLTAYAHLGPPLVLAGILCLGRQPGWKALLATSAVAVVLAFLYALFLKQITPSEGRSYFTAYALDFGQMVRSGRFFLASFHRMLGPLFILLACAALIRVICQWKRRPAWPEVLSANAVLIYCLLGCGASVAAALPWPHLIPRYLLPPYLLLCTAIGLEIMLQVRWAKSRTVGFQKNWQWVAVFAGMVVVLVLKVSLIIPVLLGLGVFGCWYGKERMVQGILTGVFAVGLGYFGVFAWNSRASFLNDYVVREKLDSALLSMVIQRFEQGQRLGILGDARDERFGSMVIFARRQNESLEPVLKSIESIREVKDVDLVLVEEEVGKRKHVPFPTEAIWRGKPSTMRPISFWEWRRRLWEGRLTWPMQEVQLPPGWTLYRVLKD